MKGSKRPVIGFGSMEMEAGPWHVNVMIRETYLRPKFLSTRYPISMDH
jgi:hypothetical protein